MYVPVVFCHGKLYRSAVKRVRIVQCLIISETMPKYLVNKEGHALQMPNTLSWRWRGHLETAALTFLDSVSEVASKDLQPSM